MNSEIIDAFKEETSIQKKSINSEVKFDVAKWDKILQRRMAELIQEVVKLNGESSIESIQKTIQKSFSKAISKAVPEYIDPLIGTEGNVRMRFDVLDPNVTQFVNDRSFRFSFDVNEYTQRELKNQLNRGFEEGESIKTIKERVKMVFGFGDNKEGNYRAQRIARSEVIRASNYGQEQAYIQSGVVSGKEWLTSFDERTCPACGAMDGRIIGLNQNYFNRGDIFQGFNLNYEDIKGPPLHPNCRCTLVPVVKEEYLSDMMSRQIVHEENIPFGSRFAAGEIDNEEEMRTGTMNKCYKVHIGGDGEGIYKNERQEITSEKNRYYRQTKYMMSLAECSMVQREVLASEIDKILGFNLVPETVLKKGMRLKTVGSTQQFIKDFIPAAAISPVNIAAWNAKSLVEKKIDIIKMAVYDDLIAGVDRHLQNLGTDSNGKIWFIDNGASFAFAPQKAWNGRFLERASSKFVDKYFPEEANKEFPVLEIRRNEMYVETAKSVGNKLYANKEVIDNLFDNAGLTTREIDAFWERAAAMKAGKFVELEERILESFGYLRR